MYFTCIHDGLCADNAANVTIVINFYDASSVGEKHDDAVVITSLTKERLILRFPDLSRGIALSTSSVTKLKKHLY